MYGQSVCSIEMYALMIEIKWGRQGKREGLDTNSIRGGGEDVATRDNPQATEHASEILNGLSSLHIFELSVLARLSS